MTETYIQVNSRSGDKQKNDQLESIIERTNKSDPKPEDLRELKKLFNDEPNFALDIGNGQKIVFENILRDSYRTSALRIEAAKRYASKMKDDLGYSSLTFVEKLLIDEIVMCWHVLMQTQNQHHCYLKESHNLETGIYWEKRLDMAQKRYLRAIETLAKVRRMIAQTQRTGVKMYQDLLTAGKTKICEKTARKLKL